MKVIITGGTGFIGGYIAHEFIVMGYDVTLIVRNKSSIEYIKMKYQKYNFKENIHFINSDLENLDIKDFKHIKYDIWIHTAWGGVNREEINDELVHYNNFIISQKCIKIAHELGCGVFCDTGSRAECGNDEDIISEYTQGLPINVYGSKKMDFYRYALAYSEKNNIKYIHFRLFSVTGVKDHPWSVVMLACTHFIKNENLTLGSCEQMWNYIDVRDVAKSIQLIVKKVISDDTYQYQELDNRIINIANFHSKKLREYIEEIHKLCDCTIPLSFGKEIGFDSNPDTTRLKTILPELKQRVFSETIKDILKSMSIYKG